MLIYRDMIFIPYWLNISWMVAIFFTHCFFHWVVFVCISIPLLLSDPSQRVANGS